MYTVHKVSELTGVSVRTLHHYDAIGLLLPTEKTTAGYRLYDDKALIRLQTVMLFRELEFSLTEIKVILSSEKFDAIEALADQIELLKLKRAHIDNVITLAERIKRTGVMEMNFSSFDKTKLEDYAKKAKEKWGDTEAYKEYERKSAGRSEAAEADNAEKMMEIFKEIGKLKDLEPSDQRVQILIKKLQCFISDKYYNCTPQILSGLGQMYAAGGEMTDNINKAGGNGTAEFAAKAILVYCKE